MRNSMELRIRMKMYNIVLFMLGDVETKQRESDWFDWDLKNQKH